MARTCKQVAGNPAGGKKRHRRQGSLYQEITDGIIKELDQGTAPWVKPWGRARTRLGLPKNAATGRTYSGINILILWAAVIDKGFARQTWLTYRQALSLGGNVVKGERGTTIVHADRFIPKEEMTRARVEGEEPQTVPYLKRFTVFNVAQCEGLPEEIHASEAPLPKRDILPRAEALIQSSGAELRIGGTRAFYSPAGDFVQLPPQPAFFQQIDYYRTCFHELGHWSGHASRLARDFSGSFGSRAYAREELVAELTAAFVCSTLGIEPTVRHADYIGSWLKVLKDDNRAIFRAASLASKAADFLLAFQENAEDHSDAEAAA